MPLASHTRDYGAVRKLLLLLTAVGLILAGLAYWINPTSASRSEVAYTFAEVERGTLTETISATGQLAPHSVALVTSQVAGQVLKIYPNAEFNQYIVEGEPLLLLDATLPRLQLQEAEQAVASAGLDVDRAKAAKEAAEEAATFKESLLQGPDAVGLKSAWLEAKHQVKSAASALEAAMAKVRALETKLAEAKFALDKTVIRAPVSGLIADKKVALGQMVGPQGPTPLFTLFGDLGTMEVNVQIAEGDLSKVREGLDATFSVYAYAEANVTFAGKVKEIRYLPTSVQGAVFYNTVVSVANRRVQEPQRRDAGELVALAGGSSLELLPGPQRRLESPWMLRPGMTANVEMVVRRHADAWKVPTAAVSFALDKAYLTKAAEAKLDQWAKRPDSGDWKHVWTLDSQGKPWPVFVRPGGLGPGGDTGIKDTQFTEVFDWEPELTPQPAAGQPHTYPRVIIAAPPYSKPGIFDRPNRIIS